uniref:Homeobox protein knotted-1-like 3 n=1 Tax=Ananas comosus var. bracteatus TaxID=296719 RepID=A0A6V7QBD8_ANACO|nr:unnamed protein product [Ananas comosus var. bracteatus]
MGAELMSNDMAEDGYISDSEAFDSVVQVLDAVRMAPSLVAQSDRDQYDTLLSIIDPGKKMDSDKEALLVTALKALTGAVSKIDIIFHGSLLSNIFAMRIWNYGVEARNALLELITSLAAVPDKFLDGCLHMLVSNFLPPERLLEFESHPRFVVKKKEIHKQLHMALHYITDLVPLAPMKLKEVIDRSMPRCNDAKAKIVVFVECMLGVQTDDIGEFLGNLLMAKVVDLLTDLDVNITWEDILQEEQNKGIFDMELEDLEEDVDKDGKDGRKPLEDNNRAFKGNAFAEKLDGLMVVVCEHLKSRADDGRLFQTHYVLLLCSFKEQLQQHVRVHAMEAVMACWELEQSLQSLTGVSPGEGTGATMSDDDDEDQANSEANLYDGLDGPDTLGFGPLVPTESERSLMERVRQELKHELKQGYKEKLIDIREEILRKRRAGKLPGDTTSTLKAWWQSHSKWPYPTEEDKARLVQETGLQLKQINNWFINQRKRNWHSNPSSSSVLKSKRKSNAGNNNSQNLV